VVPLKGLREEKHGKVLCYPRFEKEELERRLIELKNLEVQALEFVGEKNVFGLPVLGKGCVGVVVVAFTKLGRVALKIRRVDADRNEMFNEGKMLTRANIVDVGPKLLETSENFLLMELIEGNLFPKWLKSMEEKVQAPVRLVLKDILEQCYRLDEYGLDHGELSNAPKHIIVDLRNIPHLIDFETASINRRVSNVTSVSRYFFLGSHIANELKENLGKLDEKELMIV